MELKTLRSSSAQNKRNGNLISISCNSWRLFLFIKFFLATMKIVCLRSTSLQISHPAAKCGPRPRKGSWLTKFFKPTKSWLQLPMISTTKTPACCSRSTREPGRVRRLLLSKGVLCSSRAQPVLQFLPHPAQCFQTFLRGEYAKLELNLILAFIFSLHSFCSLTWAKMSILIYICLFI